ncbi:MAG: class I SAM-dependent methyltransferase [Chloroflexi bacterium]|nr:class I SAM-dependent methyltransferase [Chloroflexota bacterium]
MTRTFNYQRFYDRLSVIYAQAVYLLPMWRRYTEAVLPHLPDEGAILELGPGPGMLHRKLAAQYAFVTGLDLSPGMLRQSRLRLQRAELPVRLVRGNVVRLPLAAASFDGIALTFMFSAVPDGQDAMNEIARCLRPGGVVALVDACNPDNGNRFARGLAWLWERFGDFMRDEGALMQAAGLAVVERREFGAFNSIRLTVGRKN